MIKLIARSVIGRARGWAGKAGFAAVLAMATLAGGTAAEARPASPVPQDGRAIYQDVQHRDHHWSERRRQHGRPHGWQDARRQRHGCHPGQAMEKARWNGLKRVRVDRVTDRRVVVSGYSGGRGLDRMVFANRYGCPLIRY